MRDTLYSLPEFTRGARECITQARAKRRASGRRTLWVFAGSCVTMCKIYIRSVESLFLGTCTPFMPPTCLFFFFGWLLLRTHSARGDVFGYIMARAGRVFFFCFRGEGDRGRSLSSALLWLRCASWVVERRRGVGVDDGGVVFLGFFSTALFRLV